MIQPTADGARMAENQQYVDAQADPGGCESDQKGD
jgi:hypothetical protein